jgi:membrane protein implicated in regulation of membrane protease activity
VSLIGAVAYIIFSGLAVAILAWTVLISMGIGFVLCLVLLGALVGWIVRRVSRHEKRISEDISVLPNERARKLRRRYL